MLHRLSEAFQEYIGGDDKAKGEKGQSKEQSLSGFARFHKGVEGWQDVAPNQFSYPSAPLDPTTATGLATGKALGGVDAVKGHYDVILRTARDDTKMNTDRSKEVKQAYGIDLPNPSSSKIPGPTQVYSVGNSYIYKKEQAPEICAKYGGKVATSVQLEEAQKSGANWCYSGWVAEGSGKWPITTQPIGGCGGRQGVIQWTPYAPEHGLNGDTAGVTCYGPKPSRDEKTEHFIWPFNEDMWDQPTEPTYITLKSGYLESSGPQPACFNGLSPDQAKSGCDRLGSQCVGFSYSKDGGGHGCYKGNHAAGINGNTAYMGYVKVPVATNKPIDGRYIRIDYNRPEALNLAQLLVYSSEGGKNIITAETKVTKSSGYYGDNFPASNLVNQRGNQWYNFAHTSGSDVPWIEVDLGSIIRIHKIVLWNRQDCCLARISGAVLSVLDQDREKVYISNSITSINQTYTWYPPNGDVLVDRDPIRSQKPFKPSEWKCLAGMPTPLRRNESGEIECMSYNARDCLWGDDSTCRNLLTSANFGAVKPLVCGEDHARKWGGIGYDNPGHWCARADNII